MTPVEILPLPGVPEVLPGDDLPALLADALALADLVVHDGDVLAVTQKVVSKAEARVVRTEPVGRSAWVARETRRVVARRDDLVIAETRHGFVCANAGVDASNVAEGFLSLLPEDPDGSAERIRAALAGAAEPFGVVVTDTFGRAWRRGLVDVAIGCAGLPAVVDLRGTADANGRSLEVTELALADQVAAAAGLVMGKADGIPAALVRGLTIPGPPGLGAPGGEALRTAAALIRPPEEDLFRESPLQAIHGRRSVRRFSDAPVPRAALEEAVRAACTAPAPHHTRPWLFVFLDRGPVRMRLLAAMASAWTADLLGDHTAQEVVARRLAASDALLGEAPALAVPCVRLRGAHGYSDAERSTAEREMFLLSGGAAIQNLMLALHAQGLASCWVSSTLFCKEEAREALGLPEEWIPLGSIAVGRPPEGEPSPPRPAFEVSEFVTYLS